MNQTGKLNENYQMAISRFKDDEIINQEAIDYFKENIHNKNYIYIACKLYKDAVENGLDHLGPSMITSSVELYDQTKTYLKLDLNTVSLNMLIERNKWMVDILDDLPKLFRINNQDIRKDYSPEMNTLLSRFFSCYKFYEGKNDIVVDKVNSVISAKNKSISELIDILYDGELGNSVTLENMRDIMTGKDKYISPNDVVWSLNGKHVLFLDTHEKLIHFGSGTFWCHTYKASEEFYNHYSIDGIVVVFVDVTTDGPRNLCTIIKKLTPEYLNSPETDSEEVIYDKMNKHIKDWKSYLFHFLETQDLEEISGITNPYETGMLNENVQQAVSKFKDDEEITPEIINFFANALSNKNYVFNACRFYKTALYNSMFSVDKITKEDIVEHIEFYLVSKNYLTVDLNTVNIFDLENRNIILNEMFQKLPKNFRVSNREIRSSYTSKLANEINLLVSAYQLYARKPNHVINKINTLLSTKDKTIHELLNIMDSGELGDVVTEETMNDIKSGKNKEVDPDCIVWNNGSKYFMRFYDEEQLAHFASGSFWCHTYSGNDQFYTYSINGEVYVLVDTSDDGEDNLTTIVRLPYQDEDDALFELVARALGGDDDARDEYFNTIDEGNVTPLVYNKTNQVMDSAHMYLFKFFNTTSQEKVLSILEV